MTQELRQAIELLQFNSIEIYEYLESEMLENPLLEMETSYQDLLTKEEKVEEREIDWKELLRNQDNQGYSGQRDRNQNDFNQESFVSYKTSLREHLMDQLRLSSIKEAEMPIAIYIIENLDNRGYLRVTSQEIAELTGKELSYINKILREIQGFDPLGIAARDLKECLQIQIRKEKNFNPYAGKIIDNHLDDLANNRILKISKSLAITIEEVEKARELIKSLEPMPGRAFIDSNLESTDYILPDASLEYIDGNLTVNINDVTGPRLNINSYYRRLLEDNLDEETKEFLQKRLDSALWIIKSIEQRRNTIRKVIESILRFQKDFIEDEGKALLPLTLKDVADDIEMHESTVSRATSGKYLQTPRGIYELKYFFTSSLSSFKGDVSSDYIKLRIKEIIGEEDEKKPYSDQKITNILKEEGIEVSRRTVAKYRDELNIPSSSLRKSFI